MSNPCSIRVGKDGKYCCDVKQLTVQHDGIGKVNFANLPATAIEYEVVCDEWIPADPALIEGSGCISLLKPGSYRFLVDCEAIHGTEAPEEGAMGLCCENCKIDDWGPILSAQLEALCAKILASGDTSSNLEIITELQAICDKLLAQADQNVEVIAALQALCDKLLETQASLDAVCEKIEAGNADQLACLEDIKAALANVVAALDALTGISASLEAICEKLDAANESLTALCDKLDAILAAVVAVGVAVADASATNTAENAEQLACLEELKVKKTPQCWKDKFIEGGLDNTFTSFRHTNQVYTVTFDNGDVDTFNVASATGWTDQVEQMAAGLGAIMPWAQTVDPFCNLPGGCGGLLAPVVELNQMFARYVGFRVCPGDKVPVNIAYTSDQVDKPKPLVVQYVETDTIYIDRCIDCTTNEVMWTVDGEPYEPICAIPCEESFPEVPLSQCTADYLDVCDNVNSENQADWVNVVRVVQDCGSGPIVTYMVEEDSALVEYPMIGDPVNCATGEVVEEPVLEEPATLDDFKIIKSNGVPDANYDGAIQTTVGRPLPTVPWALIDNRDPNNQVTVASGATFPEFVADLAAKGYTDFIEGELHYICPCPPGLVNPGDYFVEADGDTVTKPPCTPLAELTNAPADKAAVIEECALRVLECNSDAILDALEDLAATKEECCIVAEGALTEPARCQPFNRADPFGNGLDTTTYSVRVNNTYVDLPNPHTHQDIIDALNSVCGDWSVQPDDQDGTVLCNTDLNCTAVSFRVCTQRGEPPIISLACGLSTSVATVLQPDEPECRDYLRVWTKYERPTADNIQSIDSNIQAMLEKQCEQADDAALSAAKLCLMEAHLNPAGPCPKEVITLDKEAQELTIVGDVTANYSAGQDINLQDANGEPCGTATVAEGEGNVTLVEGNTIIKIVECELDEGKSPVQIVKATPISVPVKTAITSIKTLTAVKTIKVLEPIDPIRG